MLKHTAFFDTLLSDINPSQEAISYAQEAHERVRSALEQDEKYGKYVLGSFLYGSYKRRTAVGDIKDVDVVILTDYDITDPENTPSKVLRKLKAALARCYDDPENPEYQRRSIRVNDPLPEHSDSELTLDIIPAVALQGKDNPLMVPDKEQKIWVESHPKGHLSKVSELNADDCSRGMFVPLVKIMKWWWKYQCQLRQPKVVRPKPKGFWVECLTAENFDRSMTTYADHFIKVLENVSSKYHNPSFVPMLADPGLPWKTIQTSMELPDFKVFMTAVDESLELARRARDDEGATSSELWNTIFGLDQDSAAKDNLIKSIPNIRPQGTKPWGM
jgi:hypothetical protein